MKVARIANNIIREIIPEYGLPVEQWYGEEFAKLCEEVPDEAQCGWIKVNNEWVSPDVVNFEENKDQRIQQSKSNLANYLEVNPLLWTDGEYYSITEEKQNQLTSTLVAAQVDGKKPEWNSTGLVCKEWELEELAALGVAIKNRVKKLVKYQQEKELEIKNATTQEELNSIIIDYNTVE